MQPQSETDGSVGLSRDTVRSCVQSGSCDYNSTLVKQVHIKRVQMRVVLMCKCSLLVCSKVSCHFFYNCICVMSLRAAIYFSVMLNQVTDFLLWFSPVRLNETLITLVRGLSAVSKLYNDFNGICCR